MTLKKWFSLLLVAMMVLTLTACGKKADEPAKPVAEAKTEVPAAEKTEAATAAATEAPAPQAEEKPAYAEKVVFGLEKGLTSLSPYDSWSTVMNGVECAVFDRLVSYDAETDTVSMLLAKSVDWVGDAHDRLHVVLRDDVLFSNGDKVTADDVIYSFDNVVYTAFKNYYDHCEKISDTELDVYLKQPASFFIKSTSFGFASIVCKKEAEQGNFVGSGPWMFDVDSFVVGSSVNLVHNPHYYGEKPLTKTYTLQIIADASTRLLALQTGELDAIFNLNVNEIPNAQADENIKVDVTSGLTFVYMAWNNFKSEELKNPYLRLAVACAINKEEIMMACGEKDAKVMVSMWDQSDAGYITDNAEYGVDLSYNPEKAKEYLAKSDVKSFTALVNTSFAFDKIAAQVIQAQLANVGITMEIEETDTTGFKAASKWSSDPKYTAIIHHNLFVGLPAVGLTYFAVDSNVNKATLNNARVNELIAKYAASVDKAESDGYIKEIQKIVHDDATYIPIYWRTLTYAYSKNLEGYTATPGGGWEMRNVYKTAK